LGFSLGIGTAGSKVPCLSLFRADAAFRPDVMPVANKSSPALLPEDDDSPVSTSSKDVFRPFLGGSLAFVFTDRI
jgi:hypothetical protein